jgi:hypothetical protein
LTKSQKPIHVVIAYFSDSYFLSFKPAAEVSDHKKLLSYREGLIALPSLHGLISIKIFTQGPLAEPFYRLWERKSLLYHSSRVATIPPNYAATKQPSPRKQTSPATNAA